MKCRRDRVASERAGCSDETGPGAGGSAPRAPLATSCIARYAVRNLLLRRAFAPGVLTERGPVMGVSTANPEPGITELVEGVVNDARRLLTQQIDLFKQELREESGRVVRAAAEAGAGAGLV